MAAEVAGTYILTEVLGLMFGQVHVDTVNQCSKRKTNEMMKEGR